LKPGKIAAEVDRMNKALSKNGYPGFALVNVIFAASLLFLIGVMVIDMMSSELKKTSYFRDATISYYLAEAGVQKTLAALKKDPNYKPAGSESLGDGYFEVSVQKLSPGRIKITSRGFAGKAKEVVSVVVEILKTESDVELNVISWKREGKEEN
jgi:ABC-type Na+ efflux pump permease subunit